MLFRESFLDGLRDGTITVAFRSWRRPTVRAGGTLLTPVGQLSIGAVSRIPLDQISEADARLAGYASIGTLLAELSRGAGGDVYRIELGPLGPDPRSSLRKAVIQTDQEHQKVMERLRRLDASGGGPWTLQVLELIGSHPGLRAADLCRLAGQEKVQFKLNVRKLKSLGLTESLEIGYRLSPRGEAFLRIACQRE